MLDIAIFAALGWERRAATAGVASLEPAGARQWSAAVGAGRCLFVQTGLGQERAGAAARDVPPVALFVSCGCAGALVDWLRPGDVVLASQIVPVDGEALPADASLATWAAKRGVRIHVGPIASSPTVLESARAKAQAGAAGALVVEMEGAALAREARTRGIPFVDLRVVLDVQGQDIPALDVLDGASGEIRTGRAAAAVAIRPWLWRAFARIGRQTRIAERSLRTVMGTILADAPLASIAPSPAPSAAVS
jgi:4-hydroxy-3-methylbut-2-enyl diphosphate reductase